MQQQNEHDARRKPMSHIRHELSQSVDRRKIKERKLPGGATSHYVPWQTLWELMEEATNYNFDWRILSTFTLDATNKPALGMNAELTIHASDGSRTVGTTAYAEMDAPFGDPVRNCEATAFRRCCAKLGLARAVHWENHYRSQASPPAGNRRAQPPEQRRQPARSQAA